MGAEGGVVLQLGREAEGRVEDPPGAVLTAPGERMVVAHAASGKKLYFPDIIALDDGRLLAAYYEGSSHVGPDGKIFVTSMEEVIRIRTGERGPDAL